MVTWSHRFRLMRFIQIREGAVAHDVQAHDCDREDDRKQWDESLLRCRDVGTN